MRRILRRAVFCLPLLLVMFAPTTVFSDAIDPELLALRNQLKPQSANLLLQLQGGTFTWFQFEGTDLLVSQNGRYAIGGDFKLMDMWNLQEVKTPQDLIASRRINFARIGVKLEELGALKYGRGKKEVTVFIDPVLPQSKSLFSIIDPLKSSFTFNLIMIPSKGGLAGGGIFKLACLNNPAEAVTVIKQGTIAKLPKPSPACQPQALPRAMVTAQLIGINRLPYTVAANGEVFEGIDGLNKFILENQ